MDNQTKNEIIAQHIRTAAGRQRLAASMIQPLRRRRDYTSVGRKAFYVEALPDGALPIYDKDPNITAYVIGEEGENIVAVAKPKRVLFPLFEIASNPEIQLTEIKQRRFDLIERAQDLARAQIQAAELFLGGPYTLPFWTIAVFTGMVIPAALEFLELRGRNIPAYIPALLILTGNITLRFIIVYAGQASRYLY